MTRICLKLFRTKTNLIMSYQASISTQSWKQKTSPKKMLWSGSVICLWVAALLRNWPRESHYKYHLETQTLKGVSETNKNFALFSWPLFVVCFWMFIISWIVTIPVTVTTRIHIFLVGDPYKPSFATVTGRGDNPSHKFLSHAEQEIVHIELYSLQTWVIHDGRNSQG